jgi:hypothetical protein
MSRKNVRRVGGKKGYARGLTAGCSGFDSVPSVSDLELAVSTSLKKKVIDEL